MSESDPIKSEDIIQDGLFDPAIEGAKLFLEAINQMEKGIKSLSSESTKYFGESVKSLAQLEQRIENLQEIEKLDKASIALQKQKAQAEAAVQKAEQERLKVSQEQEKVAQQKIKTEKDSIALQEKSNKTLKDTSGILGQLIKQKKELQGRLLGAKTSDEIKSINNELFKVNGQIKDIKEGGTKSLNTWSNALNSFQFKFNALGNVVGGFFTNLLTGGMTGILTGITSFVTETELWKDATAAVKQQFDNITDAIGLTNNAFQKMETKRLDDLKKQTQDINDEELFQLELKEAQGEMTKEQAIKQKEANIERLNALKFEQEIGAQNLKLTQEERDTYKDQVIETAKTIKSEERAVQILKAQIRREDQLATGEMVKEIQEENQKAADEKEKLEKEAADKHRKAMEEQDKADRKRIQDLWDFTAKAYKELEKMREDDMKKRLEDLDKENSMKADDVTEIIYPGGLTKEGWEKKQKEIEKARLDEIDNTIHQIELTEKLSDSYFEAAKAKLGNSAEDQKKLERLNKMQEASEIALAFFNSYEKYTKENPKTALAKATKDVFMAKVLGKTLAGAFKDGVENLDGEGTATSDSNLALLSKGESVVTAKATAQNRGMVTAMNTGKLDDYLRENYLPKVSGLTEDTSKADQVNRAMISILNNQLQSIDSRLKNMKQTHFSVDAFKQLIVDEIENGVNRRTTHMKNEIVKRG